MEVQSLRSAVADRFFARGCKCHREDSCQQHAPQNCTQRKFVQTVQKQTDAFYLYTGKKSDILCLTILLERGRSQNVFKNICGSNPWD